MRDILLLCVAMELTTVLRSRLPMYVFGLTSFFLYSLILTSKQYIIGGLELVRGRSFYSCTFHKCYSRHIFNALFAQVYFSVIYSNLAYLAKQLFSPQGKVDVR